MLRDDAATIVKEINSLYEQKNTSLSRIKQLYLLQESSLKADLFDEYLEQTTNIDELIMNIERLNFEISAKTDSFVKLSGLDTKSFEVFYNESNDADIVNWKTVRKTSEQNLADCAALNDNLIKQLEEKTKDYKKSADELAILRRIRKIV